MKVCKWLNEQGWKEAVVRVDKGEHADIDEMARLLDGDTGHFGYEASLVKIDDPEPEYYEEKRFGKPTGRWHINVKELGFHYKPDVFQIRYYSVKVDID